MRKAIVIAFVTLIALLTACSADKATPNDRFNSYVEKWNKQEFADMYKMLSSDTTDTYPTDQFVDRYKKIYEDLNVSKLQVEFDKLDKDSLEKAMDQGKATIPFNVSMETIAGPVSFDYKAELVQQGEDKEENWYISWDPGFIFPEIKDGGEISITSTAPVRGEIRDRNDMPLAMNDTIYTIGIVPEKLGASAEQNKKKIANLLGVSVESINESLNASWVEPNLFVPIAKIAKTDQELWNKLVAIDGITRQESTGRVYPGGEATGSLVGYIGQITAEELKEKDPEYVRC
ncbi:NTF2-like N-terminal transpeptidase domain-containing protein [Virgibacillus salarius]|uniref:NTF2-like N-terminal transpeptidase domain-containing protein n=1 Tax=Virgibacillus salarius TaxID=447199 RepID=UPI002491EE44|nr:NTF2-like N-terminal transpeptidase domain-containing protein [Virgibacillus salarius]WBX78625.1 NTF2-like N-terminal transpeptidase domain-containing protein [Virgibacillus salarius]